MSDETFEAILRRVVREEVLAGIVAPRHSASEFWTDPSSGQFSMSRLGMGLLIMGVLVVDMASVFLMLTGQFEKPWFEPLGTMNTAALASVAAVYTFNSAAGALGTAKERVLGKILDLMGIKKHEEGEEHKIKIP
jgi:hypothetical protein